VGTGSGDQGHFDACNPIYRELVPQFEKATGHKVTTVFTGTVGVRQRNASGDNYDVVIMLDWAIDEYVRAGKVVPGSLVDIARATIGIAVRAGLPKPGIRSVESLKRALLAANSIGYSTGRAATT
jgi:molybdate transport system substrate-binding protein